MRLQVEGRTITGEPGEADGHVDATAIHESAHAVGLVWAGCPEQLGGATAHWNGDYAAGVCRFNEPPGDMPYRDVKRWWLAGLIASLLGYMVGGTRMVWPPPYDAACRERLEELGFQIQRLGLSAERYAEVVRVAREMAADPLFQAAVLDVARLLAVKSEASAAEIIALSGEVA